MTTNLSTRAALARHIREIREHFVNIRANLGDHDRDVCRLSEIWERCHQLRSLDGGVRQQRVNWVFERLMGNVQAAIEQHESAPGLLALHLDGAIMELDWLAHETARKGSVA